MKNQALNIRLVRIARAHVRLWVSVALGLVTFAIVPGRWTSVLIGWDVGVLCYLALVVVKIAGASIADIRRHAAEQDEGMFGLLVLTIGAAIASLGAIFAALAVGESSPLVIVTVALSWMFTHAIFALHYAHEFYLQGKAGGCLKFPDDEPPDYWDFIYFSFVIGMTFQVSDVVIISKRMRRTVIVHALVAFVFITAIIALTVSTAGEALKSKSSAQQGESTAKSAAR
jgi:uncharacterized membrane protein